MSSDVVRWASFVAKRKNSDPLISPMAAISNSDSHQFDEIESNHNINENTHKNTNRRLQYAHTLGKPITKLILLTIWLVINQNVSLVLSDANLVNQNYPNNSTATEDNSINRFFNNDYDDDDVSIALLPSDDVQALNEASSDDDLFDELRKHQIIADDDISNKKHYTSTWAVHVLGGEEVANDVARKHGFRNMGQVSQFFQCI